MTTVFRIASLALVSLPFLSHAQTGTGAALGLEIPAPAPPSRGHFLTGAYVVGNYTPLPTTSSYGYGVQPYLRYQLGSSATGRPRPFVQYTFIPYRLQGNGAGMLYNPDAALPLNPGFAPLAQRAAPFGYGNTSNYGGLGAFSVGIPMRIGNGSAELSVGGSIVEGLLRSVIDPRSLEISPLGPYWKR
ncbi:hypothetical protein [Hymenobacter terricola]|uniref:hypothetical protein n=1 Tax=Hymenobacter terricola TaxID=2819236 RepID=UPI001B30506C|nr:hypothetical protein [Hymenobacter terricola]